MTDILQRVYLKLRLIKSYLIANLFRLVFGDKRFGSSIHKNKVLFFTFQGLFVCNPKYICEKLHEQRPSLEIVWVYFYNHQKHSFPDYVRPVKVGTFQYYWDLATSKIWIENAFNFVKFPVFKKKGQYQIQTMHGSLGIKRIGADSNRTAQRNLKAVQSAKMTDFIISNSSFEDMVYRTSFWKDVPILHFGHARNDIILCSDPEVVKGISDSVRKTLKINNDIRIALFAPTYRPDERFLINGIDIHLIEDALQKRFGGNWKVVFRLHPTDANSISSTSDIVLGNQIDDIQELLIAADAGITDYSSWIFDYVLSEKPGFIYANDLDKYKNTTGFYYPIETAPFSVSENLDDLINRILSFDENEYKQRIQRFLKERGSIEDGKASSKAAEFIFDLLDNH